MRPQPESLLELQAPLSGVILPLEAVPDPVFAQRMVGDGIAIDPTEQLLCAPCDAQLIQLHRAHHALSLKSAEGIELLLHIGLDTVQLEGQGFSPLVSVGEEVKAGQGLIRFDAEYLSREARSLIVLLLLPGEQRIWAPAEGLISSGERLMSVLAKEGYAEAEPQVVGKLLWSPLISIPNPMGLHARPAATLVRLAKGFDAELLLEREGKQASLRSLLGIMALDLRFGAQVRLGAHGPEAAKALESLSVQLQEGLGEVRVEPSALSVPLSLEAEPALMGVEEQQPGLIRGVTAAPGLAIGRVFQLRRESLNFSKKGLGLEWEQEKSKVAFSRSREELRALASRLEAQGQGERAQIIGAQQELLEDPELSQAVGAHLTAGESAASAWDRSLRIQMETLRRLDNSLLVARAADLEDLRLRLLSHLLGCRPQLEQLPEETILIAEELPPSQLSALDPKHLLGFATVQGGASSHTAIIARGMGLPVLCGLPPEILALPEGTQLILDAELGGLIPNPSPKLLKAMRLRRAARERVQTEALMRCMEPALTLDGVQIQVEANIGGEAEARLAVKRGAEGVGLLRSEFLYLQQLSPPSEAQQARRYGKIAAILAPRPLTIRTLDVGGDKPLSYLPLPAEENPFLGLRGIRVGLKHPALLRSQIRAILKGVGEGARIMFPMISLLEELKLARSLVEEEQARLGIERVEIGLMIEVPSAALMAEQLAQYADFFSIGSNDLAQYTLAIDRGHPSLASQADAIHPAVLRMIQMTIRGAEVHKRKVSLCGGLASDPEAVPLLIGLGLCCLSASLSALAEVKAQVRGLSLRRCQLLAQEALKLEAAPEVRALVRSTQDSQSGAL